MEIKIFFWYLFTLFLFSSLYLTDQFNSVGAVIIALTLCFSFLFYLIRREKNLKFNLPTLLLIYAFVLTTSLSALYNQDFSLMIMPITLFVLYFTSLVIKSIGNSEEKIHKALLYSHLPLLLIPLLIGGIKTSPYMGVFYNPNAFGSVVTTIFAAVYSVFLYNLDSYLIGGAAKKVKSKLFLQVLFLLGLLFLVILSSSRTSFLAIGILGLVGLIVVLYRVVKQKKFFSFVIRGIFLTSILAVITFVFAKVTSLYDYLILNIFYKFQLKSGDTLSERGGVWEKTIGETGLFGNGSDYFTTSTNIGAHNTFISILGEYGWIPLFVFVILVMILSVSSIKYVTNNSMYRFFPLMMMICFVSLSMGEGMMFKLSMMAAFISTISITKADTVKQKEKKHEKAIPSINGQIH